MAKTKAQRMQEVKENRMAAILGACFRHFTVGFQIPQEGSDLDVKCKKVAEQLYDAYLPINTQVYRELKDWAKSLPPGKNKQNLLYIIAKIEGTK